MKAFNDTNFLLHNDYGTTLYHEVAAGLPIIDFHNHIDPYALASNKQFKNIYQLWVQNDPYKHRAMRIYGIPEDLITGNKPEFEKFTAWANCFPATLGNPLFHWSCMELKILFGITAILNPSTAKNIWEEANAKLEQGQLGGFDIVRKLGVELLCTSDDLTDSLDHHLALAKQQHEVTCLPSLRSDSVMAFTQPSYLKWLQKLQTVSGITVTTLESYKEAIANRLNFFDKNGCLLSDHSLDSGFDYHLCNNEDAEAVFQLVLSKEPVNKKQLISLQSNLLHFLGKEYSRRNWKMQLHIGAYRYTSSVLRDKVGAAGGYACIGNSADVQSLTAFLDELDILKALPKTILYTLNPADNAVFASITGSYAQDGVQGKIQYGPAWWYNDHLQGITDHLITLGSYGLLSTSIGMTTDSRTVLSFIRHDYFRRILCNLIGEWVQKGMLPHDWELASTLVRNVSYFNIKKWLKND